MEDQQKKTKPKKHKWLKWLVGILVFLLLVFIVVLPPVFSRLIIRPAIEEGFSQATSNQYQIEFNHLKWNLLSRKIELEDLKILPVNAENDTISFFHLALDKLSLDKIQYLDLMDGDVRLKSLELDGVQFTSYTGLSDSSSLKNLGDISFLNSIFIDDVQFHLKSILLLRNMDSTLFLQDGEVKIAQLQWDSIVSQTSLNWPILNQLSASVKSLDYQQNKTKIRFKNFKISEKRLSSFNAVFESIDFFDKEKRHSISAQWPSLVLDSVQRYLKNNKWVFEIKALTLEADSFVNIQPNPAGKKPLEVKKSIMHVSDHLGIEVEIATIQLKSKFVELHHQNYFSQLNAVDARMIGFNLNDQLFDIESFSVDGKRQVWKLSKEEDTIGFDKIHVSDQAFSLFQFYYKPSNKPFSFQSSEIEFEKLDVSALLFDQKLIADQLLLTNPFLEVKELEKSKNPELKSPIGIEIESFKVVNGNVHLNPEGLYVHAFDFDLSKIKLYKGKRIYLDSAFTSFQFQGKEINYTNTDLPIDLNAIGVTLRSDNGFLAFQDLKLEDSTSSIPAQMEFSNLSLSGFDWRKIYRNDELLEFDSLTSDSIKVLGELALFDARNKEESKNNWNFKIRNVDLADIELDLNFEKDGKNRRLYFEKLDLICSSLRYNGAADKPITVDDLKLESFYSSFSENLDSLLFSSAGWRFSSENDRWESQDIFLQVLYSKDSIKAKSKTRLNIPKVAISGLNPYNYLIDKKIEIDSLVVLKPDFSFDGERMTSLPNQETKNWQEKLRAIVERFVHIDFNYIQIEKADLVFKNNYMGRRDQVSIEEVDLKIGDFYLDYQTLQSLNRFAFSKEFKLDFKNYFFNINNGKYLFDIQNGRIDSDNRSLKLNHISFLSISDSLSLPVNFQIQQIGVHNVYLQSTSGLPALSIGSFYMQHPAIQLKRRIAAQNNQNGGVESINLYNYIKGYLSSLALDRIDIRKLDFKDVNAQNGIDLKDIKVAVNGVQIDRENKVFTDKKFFYSDHLELLLPQFDMVSEDRFYHYQMQNIQFISSQNKVMLDSLKITSRYDRKTFSANLKFQKDQIDAMIPHLKVSNIDIRDAVFRRRYKADKIDVYQPKIWIYKDKTLVIDTSNYKYMPAQLLSNLKFYVNIDTAQVHNAFLQYEEFSNLMSVPGKVYFTGINSKITGISNDKDLIEYGGAIKILANGKIMSKSNLTLTAVFPLNAPKQDFVMLATMDQLNAIDLNPLIQPLTLLSAKEGNLMQMQMNVKGNNDYAYGEMLLKYESLKVEVMNKKLKESGLATFLANALMIRKNNKNFLFPRKGPIYFDRVTYRSFIHYMIHSAIVGTKTSLGVDKRKTQRKVDEVRLLEK